MVTHKEIGENRGKGGPHGYTIHLIIEVTLDQEVSFLGSKLKQPFKLIFSKFQPWITLSNIFDGKINTTAAVRPQSHTQAKIGISADVSIFETGLGRFGPAIFTN